MSNVANAPRWTDEQLSAIESNGTNILVAAAAGSGKTAVLVERIIRKISANTDVDRLLVATFTSAAAAEMKDRIKIALEKQLEQDSSNEHLRKQLALMGKASITTLHSFCLDVVRRYYPLIGLDPGFRIANETEVELIRAEVLEQLFEEKYAQEDSGAFIHLVNRFGGEKGDEPLFKLVEKLYLFSRSHPWPNDWLDLMAKQFKINDASELAQSAWIAQLGADALLQLEGAVNQLELAMQLTREPAGPYAYASAFEQEILMLTNLLNKVQKVSFEGWKALFDECSFQSLPRMTGKEHSKELQALAKDYREKAKKAFEKIKDELFARSLDQYLEELSELAPIMDELVEVIKLFAERFASTKKGKGLLDFGDLEHYCLAILLDKDSTPSQPVPSEAAKDYQGQFDEILLDEYQDTNMVQETICALIANPQAGNRFMVGDVKQSIYRFRLAEPKLFMEKYRSYTDEGSPDTRHGKRIDLARNFRSRSEVVDAVNIIFKVIMKEQVAEMEYDSRAELVHGASYFPAPESLDECRVHVAIIDRSKEQTDEAAEQDDELEAWREKLDDYNTAQLEANYVAQKLLKLKQEQALVYDNKLGQYRPMQWRDSVILMRATSAWAPIFIEELQKVGIPAYSNIGSGYFEALEVQTMLSCLQIIDNPYQDIPLAATLRSPMFRLNSEALAQIRILSKQTNFYDAVLYAAGSEEYDFENRQKLSYFLHKMDAWRQLSRNGPLSDLLWLIYEETGYFDFVGGLPGGTQRQANLRALHDRARQYEATSFRGLFRFLQFIERLRASNKDLGAALAIGEQEDVVKIMTTHASKGLEFPIVFVAGLGKKFNETDLKDSFLYHKELGLGPKYIDPELRISYPTLPYLAIKRVKKMELLAEEMRILYVALTRPKEKLYLLGSTARLEKEVIKWHNSLADDGRCTNYSISAASTNLDWIAPIIASYLGELMETKRSCSALTEFNWIVEYVPQVQLLANEQMSEQAEEDIEQKKATLQALQALAQLDNIKQDTQLRAQLERTYSYESATKLAAKTSITEMKRMINAHAEQEFDTTSMHNQLNEEEELAKMDAKSSQNDNQDNERQALLFQSSLELERPSFLGEKKLSAVEKGSIHHLLMQHLPLESSYIIDQQTIKQTVQSMIERKLLTSTQARAIDALSIEKLFTQSLGERMLRAKWMKRELPFGFLLPAEEVYRQQAGTLQREEVFIQGVIDCLFEDEQGLVLVDYKTDRIYKGNWQERAETHRFQLEMYAKGLSLGLNKNVDEIYVFFFDGGQAVKL